MVHRHTYMWVKHPYHKINDDNDNNKFLIIYDDKLSVFFLKLNSSIKGEHIFYGLLKELIKYTQLNFLY